MRGDFMHAGPCKQDARGHSLYFPLAEAGWDEEYPYWAADSIEGWMKDPAISSTMTMVAHRLHGPNIRSVLLPAMKPLRTPRT